VKQTVALNTETLRIKINEKFNVISSADETNSVALVRTRTMPTERPPLVGEVSADENK
jgi:hypothetical protein